MAELNPANPAAENKPDVSKQISDLTDIVKQLANGLKTVSESNTETAKVVTALHKAHTDAAAAAEAANKKGASAADAAGKPLTAEELNKLLDERDTKRNQTAEQQRARETFVAEKLKGVPAAYHGKLGSDPTKWVAEEQQIRETYRADLKAAGVTVPNVGDPVVGQPAGAKKDLTKLSTHELMELASKQKPVTTVETVAAPANPAAGAN